MQEPRPQELYWSAIPEVQVRHNLRSTGTSDLGWHVYCASLLGREARGRARMLFLRAGWLERDLFARKAFATCDVIDPSPKAVEAGRALAAEQGYRSIAYSVGDLNTAMLPAATYDAVWSDMALGRTANLEFAAAQIARSLRPDGRLFASEYVGPNRFALGRRQREAITAAFALIPMRYRRKLGRPEAELAEAPAMPGPDGYPGDNPEIPLRSGDVIAVLREHFDLLETRAAGGTILQFLLQGIAGNFRSGDAASIGVLKMLFAIEDALIDSGELSSDFTLIVAKPKGRR